MGQKINPNGYRFGVNRNWISRWVAKDNKTEATWLIEDEKLRKLIIKTFPKALIDRVEIERKPNMANILIYCSQPGIINGITEDQKKELMLNISKIVGRKTKAKYTVINYMNPNLSARIVARDIADAIENRTSFRVAQKQAVRRVMKNGGYGIKTAVTGRLGGTDIARKEGYLEGVVPLSTLRSDIDFAIELAHTTYGVIGVKVWINRGIRFGGIYAKTEYKKIAFDHHDGERPYRPHNNSHNQNGSNYSAEHNNASATHASRNNQASAPNANVKPTTNAQKPVAPTTKAPDIKKENANKVNTNEVKGGK